MQGIAVVPCIFRETPYPIVNTYSEVRCPYCGESTTCHLDPSQANEQLVIDCEVCCRPMQLTVQKDSEGDVFIDVGLG